MNTLQNTMDNILTYSTWLIIALLFQGNVSVQGLMVRLVGGMTKYEGRVEVLHAAKWGSICDDKWSHINCMIVCAQLGFSGGAMLQNADPFGLCTGPVMLDDVQCVGDEKNLGECVMSNFGQHNCEHKEDVACRCDPKVNTPGVCHASHHRIKPVDVAHPWVGRAEVYVGNVWSAICDDHWDDLDAKVFCTCVGIYNQTKSYRSYWSPALSMLPTLALAYDAVRCTEVDTLTRKNIWDCQVTASNNKCGSPTQAAGVACGPLPKAVVPEAPSVTLECAAGKLTACFTSHTYSMSAEYLSLDPVCAQGVAQNITSGVCYDIDMEKCDAEVTSDFSEKHFCYLLTYNQFDNDPTTLLTDAVWSRHACCSQGKNGTVRTSFKPLGLPAGGRDYTTSPVNFTLDCYLDQSFSGRALTSESTVTRGQDVFCKVTSSIWDDNMYLVVPSCHFYGTEAGLPSFPFLSNKCPTTEVLGMYFYNFDGHSWGFKFAAPRFQQHNTLFLSCNAYVCDPSLDPKPYCDRSCSSGSRRLRRELSEKTQDKRSLHSVSMGPFSIIDSGFGPLLAQNTQAKLFKSPPAVSTQHLNERSKEMNRTPKKTFNKVVVQTAPLDSSPGSSSTHGDSRGAASCLCVSTTLIMAAILLFWAVLVYPIFELA